MSKEDVIEVEGIVTESLPNTVFKVIPINFHIFNLLLVSVILLGIKIRINDKISNISKE